MSLPQYISCLQEAAPANTTPSPQLIDQIRHSVTALRDLPPAIQLPVRLVYYEGIRRAFAASTAIALGAVAFSWFARSYGLRSTK